MFIIVLIALIIIIILMAMAAQAEKNSNAQNESNNYGAPSKGENVASFFFFHLLMFLALGFASFGVGGILFQLINKFFPDPLGFTGFFDQGAIKFGIASLLVATPLFFYMARLINKNIHNGEMALDAVPRRWLTYVVLFLAAGTMAGDIIALIFNYLEGDIVARLILKIIVIMIIAGAIFGYYLWDIRKNETGENRKKINKLAGWASMSVMIAIFIGSFFIVDSPRVAKDKKIDQQTVENLSQISFLIQEYYNLRQTVPGDLDELKKVKPFELNQPVTYSKKGDTAYTLCADFRLPSEEQPRPGPLEIVVDEWKHGTGDICFEKEAIKDQTLKAEIPNKAFPN